MSKVTAEKWWTTSPQERNYYFTLSKLLKVQHDQLHPNYDWSYAKKRSGTRPAKEKVLKSESESSHCDSDQSGSQSKEWKAQSNIELELQYSFLAAVIHHRKCFGK